MHNIFKNSYAIQDPEIVNFIKHIDFSEALWDNSVTKNFCNAYKNWILSSADNNFIGLNNFTYAIYSNGASQAFDMFYIKNKNRRFRCFKGEYVYHKLAWRNNWNDWTFIEDSPLEFNDAVVISLPFSDTGNKHVEMDSVLEICDRLQIPVLIDCIYFGICNNINFDLSFNCITDVVFSLSKTFPVANARIGIRFTKTDDDDLMFVYDKMNYNNRLGSHLGLNLLQNFSPDFVYNKYKSKQLECCSVLNITPSNTVLFGVDNFKKYNQYNRGTNTNRLSLQDLLILNNLQMKEILYANSNKQ